MNHGSIDIHPIEVISIYQISIPAVKSGF